ncbi:uncharacterized protein LOC104443938 isoform X2 [Eucalyptus grandis]|uniref:uncharacterized protein LOC104443938 isoform X2 n=1 Tax=Eucalyptus grandis TaxID=71139 RepID=UPI00192EEAF7|nr:uncharacterized protein LOC104443938 isoform X2 [Eucalyptus grandis]
MAESNHNGRVDEEALLKMEEAKRKKRMKWTIGIIAFVIFQNTNWGPFKYDASSIDFTYGGFKVGQATILKGKANFKSTKKIDVNVTLSSTNLTGNSNLRSDLSTGLMNLTSQGELSGKVTVMFMFKKRKISQMNCTMAINTLTSVVQALSCK